MLWWSPERALVPAPCRACLPPCLAALGLLLADAHRAHAHALHRCRGSRTLLVGGARSAALTAIRGWL